MEYELFEAVILNALKMVFIENKEKSILVEGLSLYWSKATARVIRYFSDTLNRMALSISKSEFEDTFTKLVNLDTEENIFIVCNNNSNLFNVEDNLIVFKNNINVEDFNRDCSDLEGSIYQIYKAYELSSDNLDLLDTLGLSNVESQLNALLDVESDIEDMYLQDDFKDSDVLYTALFLCLNKLNKYDKHKVELRRKALERLVYRDYESEPEEYLNPDVFENNELYDQNAYIEDFVYDIYQKAIFCTDDLFFTKAEDYMADLSYLRFFGDNSNNEEDSEQSFSNQESIVDFYERYKREFFLEKCFYFNYIMQLNEFMDNGLFYNSLNMTKRRLLFALSTYDCRLVSEKKIDKVYNTLNSIDYDEKDFFDYYILSDLYIRDIFSGKKYDINTVRELLFIRTYYKLTNSLNIKQALAEYIDNENYNMVNGIIFDNKTNVEETKKLLKIIRRDK